MCGAKRRYHRSAAPLALANIVGLLTWSASQSSVFAHQNRLASSATGGASAILPARNAIPTSAAGGCLSPINRLRRGGEGLQWRPLPKAEAPTEPAGETCGQPRYHYTPAARRPNISPNPSLLYQMPPSGARGFVKIIEHLFRFLRLSTHSRRVVGNLPRAPFVWVGLSYIFYRLLLKSNKK